MRISFLHTVQSNQRIFEEAAVDLGLRREDLSHELRVDLRQQAEQAGPETEAWRDRVKGCLLDMARDADAVVVTCATLAPVADTVREAAAPIFRADTALAAAAAGAGRRIVVLCAAASTVEINRRLFESHAAHTEASVQVLLVPDAWDLFTQGRMPECLASVARSADQARVDGADVIAFAHPWMAPAAEQMRSGSRPLDSARAVLAALQVSVHSRSRL